MLNLIRLSSLGKLRVLRELRVMVVPVAKGVTEAPAAVSGPAAQVVTGAREGLVPRVLTALAGVKRTR